MTAVAERDELQIIADKIAETHISPEMFVRFVYPWGEAGPLQDEDGPDQWQLDVLREVESKLRAGDLEGALQIAVRSGHGIGKTALLAWIIHWFISTRPHPQIVVTANTKDQLTGKTWRELAKWHKLSIHKEAFRWTATKFYHANHPDTWFAAAIPWNEQRSEAFAGTHEKHVLMIFDEASLIADSIWEVAEGAMTTPGAMWFVFGNPTRNTGRFSDCFGRFRHRWSTREIDSRTAKKADKSKIQQWLDDWGEDSDFVRVRVLGKEPRASDMQFIGSDITGAAFGKNINARDIEYAPKVIGVDPSRSGDKTVIIKRQGFMTWPAITMTPGERSKLKTENIASRVAQEINEFKPDGVFIDVGYNPGVYDLLRSMGFEMVHQVNFGEAAADKSYYANKRAEMWGRMKEWLESGALPEDGELIEELTTPEYGFNTSGKLLLEKKEDLKERLGRSPDKADALALTFAEMLPARLSPLEQHLTGKRDSTYNVPDPLGRS